MAFALGTARDPGLQPERTSLAWTRTALAVLLNALVALRGAWIDGSAMLLATGAMLALAACALYGYGVHRGRVLLACEGQVPPRPAWPGWRHWFCWPALRAWRASPGTCCIRVWA
ncbi:DUF202 domain-containing protein [Acidovorax sp. LjRoot118]|uniref:DUF202 domain-containing protein n=1 Tax=unclassified Acidovorax TaxID=2684926 RepID=UPI003D077338